MGALHFTLQVVGKNTQCENLGQVTRTSGVEVHVRDGALSASHLPDLA